MNLGLGNVSGVLAVSLASKVALSSDPKRPVPKSYRKQLKQPLLYRLIYMLVRVSQTLNKYR